MEGLNGNGVGGNGVGREAKEISVSPPKKLLPTLRKPNGKAQSSEEEGEGAGEGLSAVNGDEDAYGGSNMDLVSNGNGSRSSFKKRRAHETLKKSMYRFGRTKPGFDPKTDYDALLGVANYSHVNVTKVKIVCRQLIAQSTLFRQFLKFAGFLTVMFVVILMQRNAYATNGMRSAIMNVLVEPPYRDTSYQFKTWYDVASVDDWWNWHQTVLLDSFYVSTYYNGKQANKIDQQVVMQHIRLNGGFRLTQRRVAPDSCAAQDPRFKPFQSTCYGQTYLAGRCCGAVDTRPFRGAKNESIVYSYESKSFYENGYYEYFGGAGQLEESRAKMQELKDNLWVNDGTRWLRTDFVGHNPNLGLLMQVELYAEISLGGQITTSYFIQGMEINKYACRTDFMRLGLEIVFLACYLGYLVQEVRDYRVLRAMNQSFSSILLNFWNVYDWIYFILVAILIAIRLYMIFTPLAPNLTVTADGIFSGTDRLELSMSSTIVESYFTLCGIVAGLSTVKLLNYFRINIHLSVLTQTLVLMRKEIFQYLVIIVSLLLLWSMIAVSIIGYRNPAFSSIGAAFESMVQLFLGLSGRELVFDSLPKDETGNGPAEATLFYYIFIIVMVFVALNVMVGIIMDAYSNVVGQFERMSNEDGLEVLVNHLFLDQVLHEIVVLKARIIARFSRRGDLALSKMISTDTMLMLMDELEMATGNFGQVDMPSEAENIKAKPEIGFYPPYLHTTSSDEQGEPTILPTTFVFKSLKNFVNEHELARRLDELNAFCEDPLMQTAEDKNRDDIKEDEHEILKIIEEAKQRSSQIITDMKKTIQKLDLLDTVLETNIPEEFQNLG
uniref:Polycystin cation channel PKD1/PKD2 domain-containing protein n=1 Tax=Hanusia phi TaxID=3032 RepID=A0A7S0E3P7_9CRYP